MIPNLFKAVSLGTSFVLAIAAARLLELADASLFLGALVIVPALSMLGRLGTDVIAIRYAGSHQVRGQLPHGRLLAVCILGGGLVALASYLAFLAIGLMATLPGATIQLWPMFFAIPFHAVAVLESSVLRARGWFKSAPFFEMGLVQMVAVIVVYFLARDGATSLFEICNAYFVGTLFTSASALALVLWREPGNKISMNALEESGTSLLKIALSGLLHYGWTWLPLFMTLATGRALDAGPVVAVLKYAALIGLVQIVQSSALLPRLAALWASGDRQGFDACVVSASRRSAPMVLGAGLVVSLSAEPLMAAYGESYTRYAGVLAAVTMAGCVVQALGGFAVPIALLIGRTNLVMGWFGGLGALTAGLAAVMKPSVMLLFAIYIVANAVAIIGISFTVSLASGARLGPIALQLRSKGNPRPGFAEPEECFSIAGQRGEVHSGYFLKGLPTGRRPFPGEVFYDSNALIGIHRE